MSIAAVSSGFAPLIAAAAPVIGERANSHSAPQQHAAAPRGRRHELVDAIAGALDADTTDRRTEQAVYRFAHALLHDLRRIGGEGAAGEGRRDWTPVGPRLGALATAAAAKAQPGAEDIPSEPSPLTPVTAALHVMNVPSSRLMEAFRALREVAPALVGGADGDPRKQLADFLAQLAGSAPDAVPRTGVLLHATA